jgi:hypothetical protein
MTRTSNYTPLIRSQHEPDINIKVAAIIKTIEITHWYARRNCTPLNILLRHQWWGSAPLPHATDMIITGTCMSLMLTREDVDEIINVAETSCLGIGRNCTPLNALFGHMTKQCTKSVRQWQNPNTNPNTTDITMKGNRTSWEEVHRFSTHIRWLKTTAIHVTSNQVRFLEYVIIHATGYTSYSVDPTEIGRHYFGLPHYTLCLQCLD